MGKAREREQLNRILGEHLNIIHETHQALDQTADLSLNKVSWDEVIKMGEQVSKQATLGTSADDLFPLFDKYGKVVDVFIPRDRRGKESSRADQKFEKKLQFYAKIRDKVSSLGAQKAIVKKKKLRSRQRKLKAYDLSALSEFLPDEKKETKLQTAVDFKLTCKSRQTLVLKEGKQLNNVLNHPAVKADPLGAIHQHLQNTQPLTDVKQIKKPKKVGKKKAKGKKSKASSAPQSMDM
ncbi:uncharacterized protein LOC108196375 isoform X6 [Daucus carota subsp. sativus]|nr:PREDICTED: putative ribosome biogenesis protein slx9-like isoform X2 [Daucus carota subsp. sativus]